jgi:hemoglobin
METIYEHAGGDEAIHHLEEIFYDKVLEDTVLSAVFTERVPTHVDHLTWFTAESFGRSGQVHPSARVSLHHRRASTSSNHQ